MEKEKKIKTLYGGDSFSRQDLQCGDILQLELLDNAVVLLLGADYLNALKGKEIKDIKIHLTKKQYGQLKLRDFTLLFTKYFSYDRIKFVESKNMRNDWCQLEKATVFLNNKKVEIITTSV